MIAIIDYGMGNLRSVEKAFAFSGLDVQITSDINTIRNASHIVLPGVGAFGAGMKELESRGFIDEIHRAVQAGKPFLGICLGMQMLFEESLEGGCFSGLGLLKGRILPLPPKDKVPHMGWNELKLNPSPLFKGIEENPYVYFVHSYYADAVPDEVLATSDYILDFCAAAGRDNIFGVQFHPEKSGEVGLSILKNFGGIK